MLVNGGGFYLICRDEKDQVTQFRKIKYVFSTH